MSSAGKTIRQRLKSLEQHLSKENPILVGAVNSYRHLDLVGRSMGLLNSEQSFATQLSWWPMISVLGTFSAGKSTFINHFLGTSLQETGNQAVDDKFTVICFGGEHPSQSLPGKALDADPRFPFYQISNELEKVARGEGRRVDTYLQLKTSHSEKLRGRIIIDSPGFDADSQRTATLRLTNHIIDLSDLVLVFFDARHPEPGAMRDTLSHLVGDTIRRPDATKFVYILNQMDTTAREDNPEAVVGAWQRALAQEGLTAGRFYNIYNPDVAVPIEDPARRARYEAKRDHDLGEIHQRMQRVGVERAYRITGGLEKIARHIEESVVPELTVWKQRWRRLVLAGDGMILAVLLLLAIPVTRLFGLREGLQFTQPGWWQGSAGDIFSTVIALLVLIGAYGWLHFRLREFAAGHVKKQIQKYQAPGLERDRMIQAFSLNTRPWHSIFRTRPLRWGSRTRKRLHRIIAEANAYVQTLNDSFTDPSGEQISDAGSTPPLSVVDPVTPEGLPDTADSPDKVKQYPG
ncbi:MAG: dynamin family protein [Gammaproteobacteria bacterium]|nr:MAG: dynamin family protein [Gammaproteobacteria bacterium]